MESIGTKTTTHEERVQKKEIRKYGTDTTRARGRVLFRDKSKG